METQSKSQDKTKETRKTGGLLFTGCLFVGMAAGWYYGHFNTGLFAGMGIGFIMMAVVIASNASKR